MFDEKERYSQRHHQENPWDGKYRSRSQARTISYRLTFVVVTIILSLLIMFSYSNGQAPVAPETEPASKIAPTKKIHNHKGSRIARDYLELMEQLTELTKDYRECYRLYESVAAKENIIELKSLLTKLKESSTHQSPEYLFIHLEQFAKKLRQQAKQSRFSHSEKRLRTATLCLEQELDIISDLLKSEVILRMDEEKLKQEELQYFIATQQYADHRDKVKVLIIDDEDGDYAVTVREVDLPSDLAGGVPDVPDIPDMPDRPNLGKLPIAPRVPKLSGSNFIYDGDEGRISLTREFTDSIINLPSDVAIDITSRVGQVDISGWPSNKVFASLTIELSLPDKTSAKELAKKVGLSLSLDKKGVHIESYLPNLSDPRARVIAAKLTIMVPSSNAVIAETSFGRVSVSNLTNSTKISSNNCNLSLSKVNGITNIVGKLGTIDLKKVSGEITIKSTMGPVSIERSEGIFIVENSLESIEFIASEGEVHIKNSGQVLVEDHHGNVTIKNNNGEVEVRDLYGDLIAHNSYKPMIIESVSGKSEIYNLYAAVDATEIVGELTVNNKFGDITVTDLRGAIFLTNQNGIINVNLANELDEGSTIFAAFGEVNLSIAERSNVDLMVSTVGGQIVNYFPVDIVESGDNQTVRYVFGRGGAMLEVTGKHSDITLSESF